MSTITSIVIFIIVLIAYMHLMNEYKTSEDLEIYEMDFKNNHQLQEICNLKQPVLFNMNKELSTFFKEPDILGDNKTSVIIKDKADIDNANFIKLPYESAKTLVKTDTNSRYYSEKNSKITSNTTYDFKNLDNY